LGTPAKQQNPKQGYPKAKKEVTAEQRRQKRWVGKGVQPEGQVGAGKGKK